MKTRDKKSDRSFIVTVTQAVFNGGDEDTKQGKYGALICFFVLCTDGFERYFWFPLKHVHRLPVNKMSCPMWVIDKANKRLEYQRLERAKVKLDIRKQ